MASYKHRNDTVLLGGLGKGGYYIGNALYETKNPMKIIGLNILILMCFVAILNLIENNKENLYSNTTLNYVSLLIIAINVLALLPYTYTFYISDPVKKKTYYDYSFNMIWYPSAFMYFVILIIIIIGCFLSLASAK
jgi:hypothetical protein